jgi:hypothetical protein
MDTLLVCTNCELIVPDGLYVLDEQGFYNCPKCKGIMDEYAVYEEKADHGKKR